MGSLAAGRAGHAEGSRAAGGGALRRSSGALVRRARRNRTRPRAESGWRRLATRRPAGLVATAPVLLVLVLALALVLGLALGGRLGSATAGRGVAAALGVAVDVRVRGRLPDPSAVARGQVRPAERSARTAASETVPRSGCPTARRSRRPCDPASPHRRNGPARRGRRRIRPAPRPRRTSPRPPRRASAASGTDRGGGVRIDRGVGGGQRVTQRRRVGVSLRWIGGHRAGDDRARGPPGAGRGRRVPPGSPPGRRPGRRGDRRIPVSISYSTAPSAHTSDSRPRSVVTREPLRGGVAERADHRRTSRSGRRPGPSSATIPKSTRWSARHRRSGCWPA